MLSRLRIEEGWFTLLLTWGLVIIAAAAIVNAELMDGLEVIPVIATVSLLTGLILAKSKFSSRTAFLMATLYGLFFVTFMVGRILPGDLLWRERVVDLVTRQIVWLSKAISQGSSRDGLIFVIHTSAIFWILGVTAAWYTFRNPKIWRVVLPSGLVLLSVIYYYYGPKPLVAYLALYTLVALIYIGRTHLVSREKVWQAEAVRYEKNIRFSFLRASLLIALIALGIAWGLPAAQASNAVGNALGETGVSDTWRGFQENWTRLFASLRSYGTTTSDPFRTTLSLGGPRSVSDALVMDVYVPNRLPYVYWQAVTYDTYRNGGWSISADTDQVLHLPDEGPIEIEEYLLREDVEQMFVNYVPNSGTIYGAPEPVYADRQVLVNRSLGEDGKALVHTIQSRFVLRQGDRYEVTSHYSYADANSLRLASETYPDYITEQYLQLPDEITPETQELARGLTQGLDNAFDKAIAIRNYLRNNITYNDQISAPPEGVEPVHYILFDNQEAYCNYYASAMIVMLRSIGVPARFVTGYTQGEWDEDTSSYRVRASNAHAWTEVYFTEFGWIPFEATASIPSGDRPENFGNPGDAFGNEQAPNELEDPTGALGGPQEPDEIQQLRDQFENLEDQPANSSALSTSAILLRASIGAGLLVLVLLGIFLASRANRLVESSIERSYARLANWAPWLGVIIRPSHTPYERANLLGSVVPEGRMPLLNLTHQFVRQQFSAARSSDADFDPRKEWRVLRPQMLRHGLIYQLHRLGNFRPRRTKRDENTEG